MSSNVVHALVRHRAEGPGFVVEAGADIVNAARKAGEAIGNAATVAKDMCESFDATMGAVCAVVDDVGSGLFDAVGAVNQAPDQAGRKVDNFEGEVGTGIEFLPWT